MRQHPAGAVSLKTLTKEARQQQQQQQQLHHRSPSSKAYPSPAGGVSQATPCVVLLFALVAAALARPDTPYRPPASSYHAPAPDAPPRYDYNYAVVDDYSGNNYNAQEARDGYDTQGSYYVLLPDGRRQRVTYNVNGDSGFLAEVVLLSALVAAALARPDTSYRPPTSSYHAPAPDAPPRYDYNYAVVDDYSGNNYNAQEARDGYDTQGSYYVLLPDGRRQRVTYNVNGDSGFLAEHSRQSLDLQDTEHHHFTASIPCLIITTLPSATECPSYETGRKAPQQLLAAITNSKSSINIKNNMTNDTITLHRFVLLSALVAAALARPDTSYRPPASSYHAPAPDAPPRYDYNYAVVDDYSGNNYNAQEARDGYDTQGSYYVLLPDGRRQRVTYNVNGDSGFLAEQASSAGREGRAGEEQALSFSTGRPLSARGSPDVTEGRPVTV
ncbi:hypothetical protein O3P69_014902 [Scylla paramamosain]|uniref:Pro-resilin n=1 Tax=Scylla paramamosain TaxID=85552 RepID=A0AAW0TYM4_SCYPA